MARQHTSLRTARKRARQIGINQELVIGALVRGGTNHRFDLCLKDGTVINIYPDNSYEKSDWKWSPDIVWTS